MKVSRLDVQNVRAYEWVSVSLFEGTNIIYGRNAQGKTTLLEAIALFAYGRSLRAKSDKELIRYDQPEARVRLVCTKADTETELAMKLTGKGKQVMVNRVMQKSLSAFLGHFQAVHFSPDDLALIKGGPDERRKFLNLALMQIDPEYVEALRTYNHLLNQRNRLIKMQDRQSLAIWDETMSEAGAIVITKRHQFVEQMGNKVVEHSKKMSDDVDRVAITYKISVKSESVQATREALLQAWHKNRDQDFVRGYTTIGPHREDLVLAINDRRADTYSSQGQQRSFVLALKLALVDVIREQTGEYPVLLLDDVLSELDPVRQEQLMQLVMRTQTIITTTQIGTIPVSLRAKAKIFHTGHGILEEQAIS